MRSLAGRIWSLSLSCTISLDTDGLCNPVKQPSPTPEILLTYTRTHKEQWTTQVAVNILGPVTWIWYISFPSPKTLLRNQQPDRWGFLRKAELLGWFRDSVLLLLRYSWVSVHRTKTFAFRFRCSCRSGRSGRLLLLHLALELEDLAHKFHISNL